MENGEHQAITVEDSDSDKESPVHSTNEIEESISTDDASFILMIERLEEINREGIRSKEEMYTGYIFRVPQCLAGINTKAIEPEKVSIGPYHHGADHVMQFESYKLEFLDSLLSRTQQPRAALLRSLWQSMKSRESQARRCYSEPIEMSSEKFIEMMVLDGCFIIELLQQVCGSEDNSLMVMKPWLIPTLIRDLLKLENQLPFFVLQDLFNLCIVNTSDPLSFLALKFFNLAQPRSSEFLKNALGSLRTVHLLDLFRSSYLPKRIYRESRNLHKGRSLCGLTNLCTRRARGSEEYGPLSDQSMPCVTRLRPAGIKFRPRESSNGSFEAVNFRNRVLEIPPITINDFTSTFLINCAAFEQCCDDINYCSYRGRYFSSYIAFMSCLINSGRDVAFLRDDKIITNFSYNDLHVAHLFKKLGENVGFNIRECCLSKQFTEVETYYSSNWATLRRTYFGNPWSTISVISASILLALTAIQTIMAILSNNAHRS